MAGAAGGIAKAVNDKKKYNNEMESKAKRHKK